MQTFNYHTHTYRCKHATGSDEEYVLAAIEAGYKTLGFSDHAPYKDYPSNLLHMDFEQVDEYIDSINLLKEKYKDQINIHIGFESEYIAINHDERAYLRSKVEYMILGQHYLDLTGDKVNFFKNNSEEEIYEYGRTICEAIDTGLFLYLCHPDVVMTKQTEFSKACEDVANMIGKKCSENNIPVELNIRGMERGMITFPTGTRYYYPNYDFWKVLSQYPINVVIGIDAHKPADLLDKQLLQAGLDELKTLNLNFITEPFI